MVERAAVVVGGAAPAAVVADVSVLVCACAPDVCVAAEVFVVLVVCVVVAVAPLDCAPEVCCEGEAMTGLAGAASPEVLLTRAAGVTATTRRF